MDYENYEMFRAKTKLTYTSKRSKCVVSHTDTCFIYPDTTNVGYYIALSLDTRKAAPGTNASEAYVNLIVALAGALQHKAEHQPNARLGEPVETELRRRSVRAHRIEETDQLDLMRRALAKFTGRRLDDVEYMSTEKLHTTRVEILEETMANGDATDAVDNPELLAAREKV